MSSWFVLYHFQVVYGNTGFLVETNYMNFKSRGSSLSLAQGLEREMYSIE